VLLELSIKNYVLISDIRLEFHPGLTVLTGETGAGKSMITDALGTVLGGRAFADRIGKEGEECRLEAGFDIEAVKEAGDRLREAGYGQDPVMVICRQINKNGRNKAYVNARMAPVSLLNDLARYLVDIHGQHEQQSLLRVFRHIDFLDEYGGDRILEKRREIAGMYARMRDIVDEIKSLQGDTRERERTLDLLRFQVDEIEGAGLESVDEEELIRQRRMLSNAERLYEETAAVYDQLYEGGLYGGDSVSGILRGAVDTLTSLCDIDAGLTGIRDLMESALIQLEEASHDLRRYIESINTDPEQLRVVDEQLNVINRLKKKYGETIQEILSFSEQCRQQIEAIEGSEERVKQLEAEKAELGARFYDCASRLRAAREEVATDLQEQLVAHLADLNMEKTRFSVRISDLEAAEGWQVRGPDGEDIIVNSKGRDRVEFQISPNPGEPLRPLNRIASGGEMSRVMLALKTILADVDQVDTMIFDEVDAGIGGRTAHSVAEKLVDLARRKQVICVTHLPQIACRADHHYLISKSISPDGTVIRVEELDGEDRVREIARMLGGTMTEKTLAHAREMLRNTGCRCATGM